MRNEMNNKIPDSNCAAIEALLYLKDEELTPEELNIRKYHIDRCAKCMAKFNEIQAQQQKNKFEPFTGSSEELIEAIQTRIDNLPNQVYRRVRPWIFQKQVQRILAAACVLLFIVFSVEQVNTISRISNLETRIQNRAPSSYLQGRKGELLVINHFISWDDIKASASRHLNLESYEGLLLSQLPKSKWISWQQGLSPIERNNFIRDLINKVPTDFPLLRIGRIADLNPEIAYAISPN